MATAKSCLFNQLYDFRPALNTAYRYSNVYAGSRTFNIYSGTDTIESFNTIQDAVDAGIYPENLLLSNPISKKQMLRILHGFQGINLFQRFAVNSRYTNPIFPTDVFGVNGGGFTRLQNEDIVNSNNLQKRASTQGFYRLSTITTSSRTEQYATLGSNYLYNSGYQINASKFGGVGFLNGRMNKLDPITFSTIPPTTPSSNFLTCGAEIVCGAESSNSTTSQMQEIEGSVFRQNLLGNFDSGLSGTNITFRPYFIEVNNSYYFVFSFFQRIQNWFLNSLTSSLDLIQTSSILNTLSPEDYAVENFEIENLGTVSVYKLQKLSYSNPPEFTSQGTGTISFELEIGLAILEYEDFSPDYNYPPKLN
jgi:hypothetical protein